MQAVYMPYRPKYKTRRVPDDVTLGSPSVRLKSPNTFSERPLSGDIITAEAYSRGKLSNMPAVSWDDEP